MDIQNVIDYFVPENKLTQLITYLCTDATTKNIDTWRDEYTGKHSILNRADKLYKTKENTTKTVTVAKLPITFQKIIVQFATAFLFGEPVSITTTDDTPETEKLMDYFLSVLSNNKINYLNKNLARELMINTKVAELWYTRINSTTKEKTYHVVLLSKKTGDDIYPHYNSYGDMDAFTRRYITKDIQGNSYEKVDVYTNTKIYHYKRIVKTGTTTSGTTETSWVLDKEEENLYKKIPVIYYSQDYPEWYDVQPLIDRMEILISRHADTNDYFGDPILKTQGDIEELPEKQETGKVLQFLDQMGADGRVIFGDAEFLTWDNAPQSVKMEYDNLKDLIYSLTQTPDLAFNNISGLGNISGLTIKMMFLGSVLKANLKEEIFGTGFTRRNNLLKTMIAITDTTRKKIKQLQLNVKINLFIPEHISEVITNIMTATGGEPVMSQESGVNNNPLIPDKDKQQEINRLTKQTERAETNTIANLFQS